MSGADEGWLLRTVTAATGEDRAIPLTTEGARPDSLLPPLNLAPGARLDQELKCCTLEKAVKSGRSPGQSSELSWPRRSCQLPSSGASVAFV